MAIKQKTVTGLIWSLIDSFANQGVQFLVGIILARILSPREFGLIGILTVVIAVSQSLVDSGFSQALIQKKKCSDKDYSTVFYFNLAVSIFLFLILFLSSGFIASFFKEPELKPLLKVLSSGLILNAFALIQRTILTKEINFKIQTKISAIVSLLSGATAIVMAYMGFGVWSLVALTLSRYGLTSLFLWLWSAWRPKLLFCMEAFKQLFSFGSKLLLSGLIDTVYRNIYYVIIGKYFSATQLGYYTRADQFKMMTSQNLQGIISRVSFPALASIQTDDAQLKNAYKRLIKSTTLITFVLMLGMAATSEAMIITLIGEKWIPAIEYLQLLCFVGMLYPLHALNLNMLNVKGRSDLFLKLEIIKKILAVPTIILGIVWGIKIMILGMFINSVIAFFLNSKWSGKMIGYSTYEQIKDVFPTFALAFSTSIIVFFFGKLLICSFALKFILQVCLGATLVFGISELLRYADYLYLKDTLLDKIKRSRSEKK